MSNSKREVALSVLKDVIERRIRDYLPDEYKDVEVKFTDVTKNNDEKKTALIIQAPDSRVTPTIYLDPFVDMYEDPLTSEDEILSKISDLYVSNVGNGKSLDEQIVDRIGGGFDAVKDIIIMQLINTKLNEENLKGTPHREVEDLSIVYRLYIEQSGQSMATIKINDQLMDQWGIKEQDLYDVAMKNTKELLPTTVMSMQSILSQLMPTYANEPDLGISLNPDMYVITNERKTNGATALICDKEAVDKLCDKLGGNMMLIPSSIHEFIAVPAGEGSGMNKSLAEFVQMIQEVNATQVPAGEILGTAPYHYDKVNGFELEEKYEARMKGINPEETKTLNFVMENPVKDGDSVEAKDEEPDVATPTGPRM